jgi:hypothetical protein
MARSKSIARVLSFALLVALAARADVVIKSGSSTNTAQVDANGNVLTATGQSTRPTYKCTATGLTATAAYSMYLEAGSVKGFKLVSYCVGIPNATAAAAVSVTIARRTTASSGGTPAVVEGTSNPAVSKMDPADSNFSGVCRITPSTPGTAGALLDGYTVQIGELGAGAADPPSMPPFCKFYSLLDGKVPTVSAGTANGISISVTSPGTGATSGSITATVIEE